MELFSHKKRFPMLCKEGVIVLMVNALGFVSASLAMVTLARASVRRNNAAIALERAYASTLTEMFKATKAPNQRFQLSFSHIQSFYFSSK